ncbi:MAG: hypothetical protein UY74_C0068G0009 [Candidatus Kaiserbacteria bacterium GW2011_GWC2_52_8b]|uniref:Uncharacterized protein n=2 Tax=Candidatus Kaiseribacteriota TaxID=1752734 RepID=A0A0G1XFG6_9BACT|nr:MAG: hypothetical protein UY74_C0068G0009 [Candidatus Kaiserbacteria bacterium GW2011_GWC2_52_8b]
MKKPLIAGMVCLAVLVGVYFPFVNYLEPVEAGIAWNFVSGELRIQDKGWNFTPPWVLVARVDLRPARVCITTASRAFSCKLVEFKASEYRKFVGTEGFHYYWWYNRVSFNWGYSEEYRGMKDILRGYAYAAKQYPFVTVIRDYEVGQ